MKFAVLQFKHPRGAHRPNDGPVSLSQIRPETQEPLLYLHQFGFGRQRGYRVMAGLARIVGKY